jgi:hypothetical protein
LPFVPLAVALKDRRITRTIAAEDFKKYANAEAYAGAVWARREAGASNSAIEVDVTAALAAAFSVTH